MYAGYTIRYLISFILFEAYCVGTVQYNCTVMPAKGDSDFMFCLQSYQELIIDRSLVY